MSKRIVGLDFLRAFAVLSVVYSHAVKYVYDRSMAWYYGFFAFDGVSIFFVLSGFLIGGILLAIVNQPTFLLGELFDFWKRRWFRTLPNYLLVLCFVLFANVGTSDLAPSLVLRYFTFTQNLTGPHPSFFPEAWSLAVEEWFYLVLPLVLFLLIKSYSRHRARLIFMVVIVALVSLTLFRIQHAAGTVIADERDWDRMLRKVVVFRLDALMLGVLAACVKFHAPRLFFCRPRAMFALGVALLIIDRAQIFSPAHLTYLKYVSLSLNPAAAFLMLPWLVQLTTGANPLVRAATFISAISYSMYLLNLTPVIHVVMPHLLPALSIPADLTPMWGAARYALFWLATIVLSALLHYLFEKPMTKLREHVSKPEPQFVYFPTATS